MQVNALGKVLNDCTNTKKKSKCMFLVHNVDFVLWSNLFEI